ncbi:DUF5017 domain-containing protein [Mangrovimonas sp. CR14]|uniref:DUF5689 domain-containing protein n=1 Tax=Mangrovimonas sp. CR14 TaxID=2706120 RepID=UPI001424720E|nr:DUF5689 domain-containing protein [Mangrovimonas sp. CR14]NIK91107.1 DUF5017 domain-containing protein [Mangrovimonas sp. CR14]
MKNITSSFMKTTKLFSLMSIMALTVLTSCVNDDDYSIPNVGDAQEPNISATTTISIVKSMYDSSTDAIVDFDEQGTDLVLEGYVISNDEAGNFYKTLIIQDEPENPVAGIQIDIDDPTLYDLYKPGRKVYVKLNGLGMENQNGVLHIGTINGTSVERIPAVTYTDYIIRSTEVAEIVPKVITPGAYTDANLNLLVQIDDMQLRSEEVGLPYANADDTYTVNRYLKNCGDDSQIIIRNSGFAAFKSQLFPTGRGTVTAVFSKYNSDYQLFIRDTDDVAFDGERCDPLFEEFFETGFTTWTAYNVIGSQVWIPNSYGNPGYCAAMSGFSGGNHENEDWLISPAIDLTGVTEAILNFQTAKNYNGNLLEVYMATNYSGGDPNTDGDWTPLSATLSAGSWSWTDSGDIDVSAAAGGNLYIAFKYTSTTSASSTWEVDNVKVFVP